MGVNGKPLLGLAPIKNMRRTKERVHGTSFGLSEAGYDIRIKQDIHFVPKPWWKFWKSHMIFRTDKRRLCPEKADTPVNAWIDQEMTTHQGRFVLASAIEKFQMPDDLVGIVHDKSTWARQGLSVFNTVIEPGWAGYLTLELVFHGEKEVFIPAGSGIAQVLFHRLQRPAEYSGKYQNQADKPIESIFEKTEGK